MILTILKQLWAKDWTLKCLVLICLPILLLTLLPSIITGNPLINLYLNPHTIQVRVALYMLFVLGFTCFDIYGFGLTQDRDNEASELRITYRIIQDMFEFFALWGIAQYVGIWTVVGCLAAHWFTTCDKLFYLLKREPDYPGEYTWLEGWSIFLFLKRIGIKPVTATFNLWALIGFLGGLAITIFL